MAMDVETSNAKPMPEGISIRGPEMMDLDPSVTNSTTNGKRKSRGSIQKSYKEATPEDSDEDVSVVCCPKANSLRLRACTLASSFLANIAKL